MAVLNYATMARDDRDVPLLTHNPLKGLPYPPPNQNPHRPMLTDEQYLKMLKVAAEIHRHCEPFFIVVHETGHRGASVRQLRWSDIDFEKKVVRWRAENDKIRFLHTTPLTAAALEALERLQKAEGAIGEQWVFPSDVDPSQPVPRTTTAKWWQRAEEKAEIEHVHGMGFHSARRKFASELKATNLRDLAYMGGWKNPQTVLSGLSAARSGAAERGAHYPPQNARHGVAPSNRHHEPTPGRFRPKKKKSRRTR